jgi:hypothetical protein
MATVVNIMADIDARLPNSYTDTTKLGWMNSVQAKIAKYIEKDAVYEFVASSSVGYALSTNIRIENIKTVYTGDSTAIADISSTTVWKEHKYAGDQDTITGYRYALPNTATYNTTSFSTEFVLYPYSTEVRVARVYYETLLSDLSTSASTNEPQFNSEWHDILKYGTMEIIAKSGNNPDVELANNYHRDYMEILREIKKDVATRKWKRPRMTFNYENFTWGG